MTETNRDEYLGQYSPIVINYLKRKGKENETQ